MKKHIHYDFIVAWAEGKQIQFYDVYTGTWVDCSSPTWGDYKYQIKPEFTYQCGTEVKKGDFVMWICNGSVYDIGTVEKINEGLLQISWVKYGVMSSHSPNYHGLHLIKP